MKATSPYKGITSKTCQHTHNIQLTHPRGNITQVTVNNSLSNQYRTNNGIVHCMMFKYLKEDKITFVCDFAQECKNKNYAKGSREVLTTVNGESGWLYCCDTNDCNSIEVATRLHDKKSKCMRGNITDFTSGQTNTVSVECNGAPCKSVKLAFNHHTSLDCDSDNLCVKHKVAHNTCKKVAEFGNLCCCDGTDCNSRPTQLGLPSTPLAPMPPQIGLRHDGTTHLNWLFVGVLIGAVVVSCVVLVVAVVLIRHCRHQRELSHQRAYSYQQLTADFADEPENGDDKLIIA